MTICRRQDGDTLRIKVLGEAPATHPTLAKSFAVALVSMLSEQGSRALELLKTQDFGPWGALQGPFFNVFF